MHVYMHMHVVWTLLSHYLFLGFRHPISIYSVNLTTDVSELNCMRFITVCVHVVLTLSRLKLLPYSSTCELFFFFITILYLLHSGWFILHIVKLICMSHYLILSFRHPNLISIYTVN